ncbi:Transglycosylase-associated protein [Thioalkalivibrio nitratireducens DSM 14787]|uniref:Transglycosylase-associated protein n=1 Tax=Thioalkalivibrio nitratireducens (strain DSM 14787 / UNIQEM 213 / ALEN2) TaxID=1255043 RepID=L0DZB5_THIND|nr:GlsB/YeaQ/YmgE family stress response membrane protein [Thioalkalivibrio nitratireducens]AGA33731.1 Transglycosylase-associated protein [Thioalkalivibrio nitratireducens DSM 14787]
MSLTHLAVILVVGGLAGWVAGILVHGGGQGIVINVVVGILGALLGGWVVGALGIAVTGGLGSLFLTATLGAVILLSILRLVTRR